MKNIQLSRRSFLAAAAMGAALVPAVAFAEEKKAEEKKAEEKKLEAADLEGTWALVSYTAEDENSAMVLGLTVMMMSMKMELKKDGTVVATTTSMLEESAEPTVEEGTWELAEDGKVIVATGDNKMPFEYKNLSLYMGFDSDGASGQLVFAKPEDVLSGDWMIAQSPETFDLERKGVAGAWTMVAMSGSAADEVQDALFSVMALTMGMSMGFEAAEDGTAVMVTVNGEGEEPTTIEGTWVEDAKGIVFTADGMEVPAAIENGKLVIDVEGMKIVFAPLA